MPRPRSHLDARIMDAAALLFARDGVAPTGMRAIAAEARVSIGAIYHHFRSKEEILEQIVHQEIERRVRAVEELRSKEMELQDQVREIVQMHFRLLLEHADSARVYFRERFDPTPEIRGMIQRLRAELLDHILDFLKGAADSGKVRPCNPALVAAALLGMMESLSIGILEQNGLSAELMRDGPQEIARVIGLWLQPSERARD